MAHSTSSRQRDHLASGTAPEQPACLVAIVDGEWLTLDRWQISSALVLFALRKHRGRLRLAAGELRRAVTDIARTRPWSLDMWVDSAADRLTFHLRDTTTRGSGGHSIDLTDNPTGGLIVERSVIGSECGSSGDPETDRHVAVTLAMVRQSGGMLPARLSAFITTAHAITCGHRWRVEPETGVPEAGWQVLRLQELP